MHRDTLPVVGTELLETDMTLNAAASTGQVFFETEDSAPAFWQIGILWRVLATGMKTGGSLCALDETVSDKAGGPVTHAHHQDEGLYLLDGACTFFAGGQTIKAGAGSFVAVPRYTQHAFMAEPGTRFVNFYLPAGFEMLLMGVAAPAWRNEPSVEGDQVKLAPRKLVDKLAADYGQIPVLGMPFADPPDLAKTRTEPLPGARATPFHNHVSTAPAYWSQGILWSVLAEGSNTDGSYALFEELCPRGTGAPPHIHVYADEVFYVVEGEAELVAGDKRELLKSGSLVFIPRGTVHAFRVRSEIAKLLNLYTQSGFERILELTGQPTTQRTLPPADWRGPETSRLRRQELFDELGMKTVSLPDPFA